MFNEIEVTNLNLLTFLSLMRTCQNIYIESIFNFLNDFVKGKSCFLAWKLSKKENSKKGWVW
jgi:hypothetical protein